MWYDIAAMAVIGIFAWKGASKGAVWQLATIASIGLCVLFASQLSPYVEEKLPETLAPAVRHWAAIGLVYLGLSFVVFLFARKLRLWLEKVRFLEFDSHWGAILGASKGALATLVATCLIVAFIPHFQDMIRASRTGQATWFVVRHTTPWLPASVVEPLTKAFDPPPESNLELPLNLDEWRSAFRPENDQ